MGIEQSGWRQLLIELEERFLDAQTSEGQTSEGQTSETSTSEGQTSESQTSETSTSKNSSHQLSEKLSRFLVVDDHDVALEGLLPSLHRAYPNVLLLAAQDDETARQQLTQVAATGETISLTIVDLDLPQQLGAAASYQTGINLLRKLMHSEQVTNILTIGASIKPLVRISSEIYSYPAGFTAIHKTEPVSSMLRMADLALRGSIYLPPDVRSLSGFRSQWLTLLSLKFQAGLSDQAIAARMGVSTRTTRNYWLGIQDFLGVYNDSDKDLRVQVEHAARRTGLID